jgi:hypothetical protein
VAAADQATALSPRTAEHRAQRSALSPNGEVVLPQAGARPERQRRPPSPPPPRPPPVMPSRRGVELVQPPSRLEVNLWSPRQQPRAQKHDRRVVRPPGAQAALDQLPAQAAMRPGSCRRGRHARSDAGCGGSYETEVTRLVRRYVASNLTGRPRCRRRCEPRSVTPLSTAACLRAPQGTPASTLAAALSPRALACHTAEVPLPPSIRFSSIGGAHLQQLQQPSPSPPPGSPSRARPATAATAPRPPSVAANATAGLRVADVWCATPQQGRQETLQAPPLPRPRLPPHHPAPSLSAPPLPRPPSSPPPALCPQRQAPLPQRGRRSAPLGAPPSRASRPPPRSEPSAPRCHRLLVRPPH